MVLFAKVVEHGSYSAAARALGLQTSKLSRRVSDLEQQLGVRLLQRTTRKVSVTEIGQAFYQHCAALEAEARAAQETIDRTRSVPQGAVRMSCPISIIHNYVSPIIARYQTRNPLVQVHLEMTNRRVDVVEEGLDIALRVRTLPLAPTNLAMRALGYSTPMLVGSPQLLKKLGRPKTPAYLADMPTVTMSASGEKYVWEFRGPDGLPVSVSISPRLVTDSFDSLRDAAVAGVGVAYIPQFVAQPAVKSGALEVMLPNYSMPPGLIHAVFPSRRGMVPAVRLLIDALAEGFQEFTAL